MRVKESSSGNAKNRARRPFRKRLGRAALVTGAMGTVGLVGAVGSCEVLSRDLPSHSDEIPCQLLDLPDVEGAADIRRTLCVSVAGEQPESIGVERTELEDGRVAITLFPTWPHDGPTEWAPVNRNEDVEPVTVIFEQDEEAGNLVPTELRVRSHWVTGSCSIDDMPKFLVVESGNQNEPGGRVYHLVSVIFGNGFHTPVPFGCEPQAAEPLDRVEDAEAPKEFVFDTVIGYAQAICNLWIESLRPLNGSDENRVPRSGHRCYSQPLY